MPQQEKITRKLDFDKRAQIRGVRILTKTANYSVDKALDSGSYIIANNSGQIIYFTLPAVADCNGFFWNFLTINTGKFQVIGATNVIVDDYGSVQKAINFGNGKEGEGCQMICNGTKFYVVGLSPYGNPTVANVGYHDG